MRRSFLSLALGFVVLATAVTPALAVPFEGNIPAHRHFIVSPTGDKLEVGPRVCDDATLQDAFDQFHLNVHRGTPGLDAFNHEHNPVSIIGARC